MARADSRYLFFFGTFLYGLHCRALRRNRAPQPDHGQHYDHRVLQHRDQRQRVLQHDRRVLQHDEQFLPQLSDLVGRRVLKNAEQLGDLPAQDRGRDLNENWESQDWEV